MAIEKEAPTLSADARLALLEELLVCTNPVGAAQTTAEWLVAHTSADRTIVAAPDQVQGVWMGVAGVGVSPRLIKKVSLPFGDQTPSLSPVLVGGTPFMSIAAKGGHERPALGLILIYPEMAVPLSDGRWVADALGRCLQRMAMPSGGLLEDSRLRREHALLNGVIDASTDAILFTTIDGQLIIANNTARMLFTAPNDASEMRDRAVQLNNSILCGALSHTARLEGDAARRELVLMDPTDGADLLFELVSAEVSDPRSGTGVVSILRNITDLRRATRQLDEQSAKLRAAEADVRAERDRVDLLIDAVADPIIVTDRRGEISLINRPAERLFTIVTGAGEESHRIVRGNDEQFTSFVSGLLSTGWETTQRGEIVLMDPGTQKAMPVEAIAATIVSEDGELTAIVTLLHDRTEAIERTQLYDQLKRASEELEGKVRIATAELANQNELLRRLALELEQASTAKSQFLASVSHELRTPLNAILGYAAMTLQGVSGDLTTPQRRNLSRIDANARQLLTLINEILDITRIEAGRMPVQSTTFDLAELVREVTAELEPIIVQSGLEVVCQVGAGLTLWTDRQKVKQILVNLLSNALKFTKDGRVTIRARMTGGDAVSVAVSDTGIGIPRADHKRIFEDFRQIDSTSRRAYGGTGLGLSIFRRLTAMLKGTLKVESRLGQGSTFTLTLPAASKR